nr:MAG TPA: hypothetical protein [Caudoviricetes sp.]
MLNTSILLTVQQYRPSGQSLSTCNQLLIPLCNIYTYSTDYKMKSILHVR